MHKTNYMQSIEQILTWEDGLKGVLNLMFWRGT